MYKIVPTERQERSGKTITKNRCKPSKNSLQRSFLAPPAGFEPVACRLGGDRSIQLSYGGLYRKYSILQGFRIRTIRFLGGGCSILLSYGDVYEVFRQGPPQKVSAPRSLRRRVLYPAELLRHTVCLLYRFAMQIARVHLRAGPCPCRATIHVGQRGQKKRIKSRRTELS